MQGIIPAALLGAVAVWAVLAADAWRQHGRKMRELGLRVSRRIMREDG
ncbi:MAG TPA: hypothetical protein VGS80_15680 [Ktedonobacterales bacterium]|jgi:hypothetical protein|nr:hypothetical protein [Ktedonobacterales bacterium]